MRETRSSGSVEGAMGNHDSYSDSHAVLVKTTISGMRTTKILHPAGKKHKFGKAWMHEHVSDHWVQEARRRGYRSRAAFKLIELAAKDRLLRPGMTVLDLGAAPGSWCQVLRERLGPAARIVAVDVLPMDPLAGVNFI